MRKMKKINGFLVVRFNDREKRDYPDLGSFGIIDAELYTGDIDLDLGEMEYTDADSIEVAVEQARGLDAEEDFDEEPAAYSIVTETENSLIEERVEPRALALACVQRLEEQIESKKYPDINPITAAHELKGYKTALMELGLMDEDEAEVEPDIFGEFCFRLHDGGEGRDELIPEGLVLFSPHDFEAAETYNGCTVQALRCKRCGRVRFTWSPGSSPGDEEALGYVCDDLCKFREGHTQDELDAICEKCRVESWAQGRAREPTPPEEPERDTFIHTHPDIRRDRLMEKLYTLGLVLVQDCPEDDCKVYLKIFNMARELDTALDEVRGYPALVLRGALNDRLQELSEMYLENYAVQQFKEGMQP